MEQPIVTSEQAGRCLGILEAAEKFMTAAEIAVRLGIGGRRETQRRRVRAIVKRLRDNGSMIIANNADGYWLTGDADIFWQYMQKRAIDAKVILAEVSSRKKMLADKKGQGMLFDNRIQAGCATVGT